MHSMSLCTGVLFEMKKNGFILSWEGDALLYSSQDLKGAFEPVPDAVSPYRVDALGKAFFKLGLKP